MTFTKKEALEAQEELRKLFADLDTKTVFVVQREVSRTGMTRYLDLFLIPSTEKIKRDFTAGSQPMPWRITYLVCKALQYSYNENREALTVGGCGMDMHFHVVYTLSRVLFKENYICTGERCTSNDHVNGDRDYTPHKHSDSGYYLQKVTL